MEARNAPQGGRTCARCKVYKTADEIGPNPQNPSRLRPYCRSCRRQVEKDRRDRNPDRAQRMRLQNLLRAYGMTPEGYEAMLTAQAGACWICTSTEPGNGHLRLVVDHDHVTGRVRGLLCNNCNVGLANFRENPSLLASAIRYLGHQSES